MEIALTIRQAIGQKLKITVSEGIGANKLVSAIASKLTKPAAFHEVPPGGESAVPPSAAQPMAAGHRAARPARASTPPAWRKSAISPRTPLEMLELLLGGQAAGHPAVRPRD